MLAEIITIGDELLIGQVIDTNSAWIAQQLNLIGIAVKQITTVSDNKEDILKTLKESSERADIILITGGLGPTNDDITKNTLCEYFNSKLVLNAGMYKQIEALFSSRGLTVTEINRKQAEVPDNCRALINKNGTAPGMWFKKNDKNFISMPGVPHEMKSMMEQEVLPEIKRKFKLSPILHKTVLTQGIGESYLQTLIQAWEEKLPDNIHLAYLPSAGIVRLRLSGYNEDENTLEKKINAELEKLKVLLLPYLFGYDEDTMEGIVGQLLSDMGKTLALAESCTGGNIAHLITTVAGSSKYFKGGIIAYANEIKTHEIGIDANDIEHYGVVSGEIVEQMAQKIKMKYHSDFALATSGIFGPSGGSVEKPVGTTYIGVAFPGGVMSKKFSMGDNRSRSIQKASVAALNMLREEIIKNQGVLEKKCI